MTSVSGRAAVWNNKIGFKDVPVDVIEATRIRILDTLGVALAGLAGDMGKNIARASFRLGDGGSGRILGCNGRTSVTAAALANGALASILSYDDTYNPTIVHVTAPLLATGLAIADAQDVSGREFMVAVAAAAELSCRLGLCAPKQFHKRGFHPTGVIGTLASAYLSARLLGLDARQTENAVGIAGSFASGLGEGLADGTTAPSLHAGWSAQAGIVSGYMAADGATGPSTVLEGGAGLFRAFVQEPNYQFSFSELSNELGSVWRSRDISLKPYPCAHVLHAFVESILALYADGLRFDKVTRIICPIADYMIGIVCEPSAGKKRPEAALQGRGSLYYTIAEALYRGTIDGESYSDQFMRNPDILGLAAKVEYRIDDSVGPSQFKGWVIVDAGADRVEYIVQHNKGSLENPLGDDEIRSKFRRNAALILSLDRIVEIEKMIDGLDEVRNLKDLTDLCLP